MRKLMRNIKNLIRGSILGIAGISLMACSLMVHQALPPGGQTAETVISYCDIFSTALRTVTPLKATMTSNDRSIVQKSILFATPICGNPSSYNTNGAIAGLKAEIANIQLIIKNKGK